MPLVVSLRGVNGCLLGTIWGERLLAPVTAPTYRRLVGAGVAAVGVWLLARAL